MDFTQTIWNDNSYQAYIEYLKSLADDKYKEFNSKITPISNESQIYGVRVPKMRDTAKLIAKGSFQRFLVMWTLLIINPYLMKRFLYMEW